MSKRMDQVIVIDLEASCWQGPPPPGEENEIIEIGICPLVVATGERLPKESLIVRPEKSKISPFCTQLTTITQEMVDGGMPLRDAITRLREVYDTETRTVASWGDYDREQIRRECQSKGLKNPLGKTHLNVKNLHSLVYGLPKEVGMDEALKMMGLPLEGTHHRGSDDAANIALILSRLITRSVA